MRSQPEGSKFHHFVGKHGTRQTGRVSCVGAVQIQSRAIDVRCPLQVSAHFITRERDGGDHRMEHNVRNEACFVGWIGYIASKPP